MKRSKNEHESAKEHLDEPRHSTDSESTTECSDDCLAPRELVGYLRAMVDGEALPANVDEHLKGCDACSDNWAFIRATDPALRQFREERVALMIRNVGADALPIEGKVLASPEEKQILLKTVEKELSRVIEKTRKDTLFGPEIFASLKLPSDRVLEMCATVQHIADIERRYAEAIELSKALEKRIAQMHRDGTIDISVLDLLFDNSTDSINLSKLNVSLDLATALVASFPQASYYPGLLERSGNEVLFHRRRFDQLRADFEILRAQFTRSAAIARE